MIGTVKLARPRPCSPIIRAWERRTPDPIACACGCGRSLDRRDRNGRPRRFSRGHGANVQRRDRRGVFAREALK